MTCRFPHPRRVLRQQLHVPTLMLWGGKDVNLSPVVSREEFFFVCVCVCMDGLVCVRAREYGRTLAPLLHVAEA